jgi:asparagine synthase (glutamine-hydrolysing)
MCGIYGYFLFNKNAYNPQLIKKMGEKIIYRGPDGCGVFESSEHGVGLGNRRLAIVDIENGNQPFFSKDGSVVVVQNGEIYNHHELRDELKRQGIIFKTGSDTEVILKLYEQHGISFIKHLNGMFAIAIYDKRIGKLYLVRDRAGVKPLYYHQNENFMVFGSEIKSLLQAGIPSDLDPQSLSLFMTYNYIPSPHTIYKSIYHVKPGHYLEIDGSSIKEYVWWKLENKKPLSYSEGDFIDEFNTILDDAVRLRMLCDVPYGAFLSGGLDSSAVVGYMEKHSQQPVKTFSIGFNDERFDESLFAMEAAQRFNTDHLLKKVDKEIVEFWPKVIYHCDQPHGDTSFIPTMVLSQLASEKVKVVLTGDGGDELFGGYEKYVAFLNQQTVEKTTENYLKFIAVHTKNDLERLLSSKVQKELDHVNLHQEFVNEVDFYDQFDFVNKMLLADFKMLLPGNNLVKPDRMGMAASIEARNPFLDYRMIEFAFRVHGDLKIKEGVTRYGYKKAVKNLIGENLTYRKKQMFTVPFGEWIRSSLKSYGENIINESQLEDFINMDYMRKVMTEHMEGHDHTRQIRQYIALEHWVKISGI